MANPRTISIPEIPDNLDLATVREILIALKYHVELREGGKGREERNPTIGELEAAGVTNADRIK